MADKILNDITKSKEPRPIMLGNNSRNKSSRKLSVEPQKKYTETFYFSANKSRFPNLAWIGILGMVIVVLINALNSFGRGKLIISDVARSSTGIYQSMMQAGEEAGKSNFDAAKILIDEAQKSADEIDKKLWFLSQSLNPQKITEYIIKTGNELINIIQIAKEIGSNFMAQESPINALNRLEISYKNFSENITLARSAIKNIDTSILPQNITDKIKKLSSQIDKMAGLTPETPAFIQGISSLLGTNKKHTALILLQNDSESRPTGGFIGSILFAEMENGKMNLSFQDVYDIDRGFKGNIEPPDEIKSLTDKWFFRDSNYSPDFPTSAQKAIWFYQQEKGIKADTVIAINQSILQKFLAITGPITVPGLAHPLDQNNYQTVISYIVEAKITVPYEPKKVLKDFIEAFQKEFFKMKDSRAAVKILLQEIAANNILAYSDIGSIEDLFKFIGMDGRIINTAQNEDYLAVIATSIAGNKSDAYISQDISHTTLIASNGEIIDEVALSRTDNFSRETEQKIINTLRDFGYNDVPSWILEIFGRSQNKSIFRIYVPSGSELIDSSGQIKNIKTIYDSTLNKTYFSFAMNVHPGQTRTAFLRYRLAFRLTPAPVASYRLITQRQPGFIQTNFTKKLIADSQLKILSQYPQNSQKITLAASNLFAALIGK